MLRRQVSKGFSLIEVVLALGVAAFSLIVIFGLLPVGLQTSNNAGEQSVSNDILSAVIADLHATPPTSQTSAQFGIGIGSPKTLYFNSEGQVEDSPNVARYQLRVAFPVNPSGARAATFAYLKMSWPAVVDPAKAAGSAETFTALNRN